MRSIRLGMTTWLLVLALLFAGCGGDDSDESGEPAESQATETTPTSSTTSTTVPIPQEAVALGELQIIGVEFGDGGFVRIQNRGSADANVNGIYICQFPQYTDLGTVVTGGAIAAGATVEVPASAVGGLSAGVARLRSTPTTATSGHRTIFWHTCSGGPEALEPK